MSFLFRIFGFAALAFSFSNHAHAVSVELSAGTELQSLSDDCEGRPCGPNAWFAAKTVDGFECRFSGFSWNEISTEQMPWRTKVAISFSADRFHARSSARLVKTVCLEAHEQDHKLCVLEAKKYVFETSFFFGSGKVISCAKDAKAPLKPLLEGGAQLQVFSLESEAVRVI